MTIEVREWLAKARAVMDDDDVAGGLKLGAYYLYVGLWLTLSTRVRFATPAFEREWDLLVVLDTCRTDALAAVADEYDFLDDRDSVRSPGSTSGEWVAHTFDRAYADEISRTAYVTANPHSNAVLRDRLLPPQYVPAPATWPDWDPVAPDEVGLLDEVWADARDDRLGVVPPATVTDRAIAAGREADLDRLVVHYMQPHAPYIAGVVDGEDPLSEACAEPFEALRRGEVDREEMWDSYLDNLRLALDEVESLLENVDAERVVITADHGEAFGEWGFYEHPVGCPLPAVKRVPWVETTATDRGTRSPTPAASESAASESVASDPAERDVDEQLRDLGYR
ncbi:hypothetical protein SAMN04488067_10333 [Halorubrum xinjiangense]|uniref:Sulfatase n=1 Tax=Halorubrum xinjiangense TaxID=261291 RepID=A0A1G7JNY6_9EURY|nr:hypothetical protein [Halorubrum xinjiangense]SDF26623.1 hypothetical protein SAMN04488067_10333 [Halorubrum xinjiangense]